MEIVKLKPSNIKSILVKAKNVLQNNGLVVFPSDTVYGLAVNGLSKTAVQKLYAFKERRIDQSVSIAVRDLKTAQQFFQIKLEQQTLLTTLLPGPYTVVLPSKHKAVAQLEAQNQTLGLRIPNFWFNKALSQALPFPYTSTSANLHNKGPHYSLESLLKTLSEKKKAMLDLLIDYGKLPLNPPSTVINLTSDQIKILRQGQFTLKKISQDLSQSAPQTKQIAKQFLTKVIKEAHKQPVVIILQGDLGTGKTVFTQGLGEALKCEPIISPTFVIYYEYLTKNKTIKKLLHFDLYRLEEKADFAPLQIGQELKPGNLLVFEWGQKLGSIFNLIQEQKALVFLVDLKELSIKKRAINIYQIA